MFRKDARRGLFVEKPASVMSGKEATASREKKTLAGTCWLIDSPFPLAPTTRTRHQPSRLNDPPSLGKLTEPLIDLMPKQPASSRDA